MLVTLGKAGIKTLDDLADLAADELQSQEARGANSAAAAIRRPSRRAANAASEPRTRAVYWANMASRKSKATKSSWPRAHTGSKTSR